VTSELTIAHRLKGYDVPDLEDLGCFVIGGIAIVAILLLAACVIGVIVVGAAFV
jgi:hypothetical protein